MDLGLQGARALVGGASGGLGAAVARALAAEGARVAVAARSTDKLAAFAGEIDGVALATDLSTADGPASAVDGAVAALGGLDLLVVNSGGPPMGRFEDLTEAQWRTAIEGTLQSALRLLRAGLPHIRAGDHGAILIILSSSVREPIPGLTLSNVLRPGLDGLVKSLAAEIAPVRINGIAPGRVATDRIATLDAARAERDGTSVAEIQRQTMERIPLGRYGEPAEIGRVAAFLLSPAASYVSAQVVGVDGAMVRSLP
ncbi:MAG TPA: SDR family oxidoreductase [Candidatus Limnocylindrales bacterium]|jgi:3-oxoacyl-[acyl-carrier protein] reductase